MPRKKTPQDVRGSKKESSDQDILKIYIDGQIEFRKALINAATAISVQSETSREVVTNLRALVDKFEDFEDKLVKFERIVSKFEDNIGLLKDTAVLDINAVTEVSKKNLIDLKDYSVSEIGKKKITVVVMLFFLAFASILGAYSLAGSKIKTEISTKGVSVEADRQTGR